MNTLHLTCTRKLSKMIKNFIKEHWVVGVIILVFVFVSVCAAIWLSKPNSLQKEKEVYAELEHYNGMLVRGKSRAGTKGEDQYYLMIRDPKVEETVCVTVTEAAFNRYDIDDTIHEVIVREVEGIDNLVPQYVNGDSIVCGGREIIKEGNHEYIVQYTLIPAYKEGDLPRFIKIYSGICHYEDCQYCKSH